MADAFYGPRSRENARLLLDTAKGLGLGPQVVRTQVGGYLVPEEVVDKINEAVVAEAERLAAEEAEAEAERQRAAEEEEKAKADSEVKRPSQADSKADWLAYAQAKGVEVTDENTKAEIVEAVKKAEETD